MSAFSIREETPQDLDGIRRMHQLAFGSTAEARLADDLKKSGDVFTSLIAVKSERVVGHLMLSRLKAAPMKALTLGPFAVHPDHQRQGIGLSLLRQALDKARAGGWTAIFVLGDTGYYQHAGFTLTSAQGFSSPYAREHFKVLTLDPANTPSTGEVVYPLPFSSLT